MKCQTCGTDQGAMLPADGTYYCWADYHRYVTPSITRTPAPQPVASNKCPVDGTPVKDTTICRVCIGQLKRDLGDIPALSDDLDITISRQAVLATRYGSRSAEKPLTFQPIASRVASTLKAVLVGWVREIGPDLETRWVNELGPRCENCTHQTCGTHVVEVWPDDTTTSISRWLLKRADRIVTRLDADALADEIGHSVAAARRVIDRSATRSEFFVTACPETYEGDRCVGEIWATLPTDEADETYMECTVCAHRWLTAQWMRLATKIRHQQAA